jgi:prepilin-type processing-associated H-X9-DG protein
MAALVLGLLRPALGFFPWTWRFALMQHYSRYAVEVGWHGLGVALSVGAVACGVVALWRREERAPALVGLVLGALPLLTAAAIYNPRQRVLSASCVSNTKQLVLGALMYASDNDDHLPSAGKWSTAIYPDVKNFGIYCCPSDWKHDPKGTRARDPSYTMNYHLSLKSTKDAGALPLLFDGDILAGDQDAAAYRHRGGLSVSFADGHARWESRQDFANAQFQP